MTHRPGSAFAERHIGPSSTDHERMLATIGVASATDLVEQAIPAAIRSTSMPGVPEARTEAQVQARLRSLAEQNVVTVPMYGLGYSQTITPAVIRRSVLENPAWYTAYTPYQPEISQGRLEALLTFQTMCSDLTGLPVANASLLDEGTAAAEAMTLMRRAAKVGSDGVFVVDG